MMDAELQHEIDVLRDKINDHGIYRLPHGSKEMPAMGGKGFYTWQFYLRAALLDARSLKTICRDFWTRFADVYDKHPFQLGGVESAAVPMITALVCAAAERGIVLNAFTIRKERKAYGRRNLIEGRPNDLPVLFIDDLTSPQHNAFWHAIHALSLHDLRLAEHAYVLVRKQDRDVLPYIATSIGTVKVESLFVLNDFSLELDAYQAEKREVLRLNAALAA